MIMVESSIVWCVSFWCTCDHTGVVVESSVVWCICVHTQVCGHMLNESFRPAKQQFVLLSISWSGRRTGKEVDKYKCKNGTGNNFNKMFCQIFNKMFESVMVTLSSLQLAPSTPCAARGQPSHYAIMEPILNRVTPQTPSSGIFYGQTDSREQNIFEQPQQIWTRLMLLTQQL